MSAQIIVLLLLSSCSLNLKETPSSSKRGTGRALCGLSLPVLRWGSGAGDTFPAQARHRIQHLDLYTAFKVLINI